MTYKRKQRCVSLNRESRENRERSRRCNPSPFRMNGRNPLSLMPLSRDSGVGRRLTDWGSQKTCLAALVPEKPSWKSVLGQLHVEGQVKRVQPFKPTDRFGGFVFWGPRSNDACADVFASPIKDATDDTGISLK
jgi:hypothetical protein